jgi:putative transposase
MKAFTFIDMALSQRMIALSRENPRYGYRRVWALLRREGWAVNKKRVQRVWREADLMVPSKERKRRRMRASEKSITRRQAEYPGHVSKATTSRWMLQRTVGC